MSATGHIRLTSHSGGFGALPINWGAPTATERGPVIGTTTTRAHRNVIGTHSGSYGVYRALAVAAGALSREHKADLTNTSPTDVIGPYPQWSEPGKIVGLDPWGALVADVFAAELAAGYDIRPTIAVTKAHVILPEIADAIQKGRLRPDGRTLLRQWRGARDQGGDRAGVVPAGRGACASAAARRICAARCSRRPAACIPSS